MGWPATTAGNDTLSFFHRHAAMNEQERKRKERIPKPRSHEIRKAKQETTNEQMQRNIRAHNCNHHLPAATANDQASSPLQHNTTATDNCILKRITAAQLLHNRPPPPQLPNAPLNVSSKPHSRKTQQTRKGKKERGQKHHA